MEFTLTFTRLFFWAIYLTAPLLIFLGLVIVGLGQIVSSIEKWDRFDGLYWSFITAITVGYGDLHLTRKVSKMLSVIIAFVGIMFTGIIVAVTLNTASIAFEKHADVQVLENVKKRFDLIEEKITL